jgi:tetratricopeptide repeat protein
MIRARVVLCALVIALGGWEPFHTADPDVEAGNRAYSEGRYDDALAAYDRAARRGGVDPDGLAFDRGTAELKKAEAIHDAAEKQRMTQRALEDLKQAAHAKDPRIRGNAHYNRGNLLMGQDKLDDAIEAYKQALREQPDLDDARLNLELALRKRQKQQHRQPQRGPSSPGQPDQPGQQGQGQGQGQQGQNQPGQGQGQGQQNGDPSQNGQNGQNGQSGGSNQPPDGQGQNPSQNGGGQSPGPSQNGQSSPNGNPGGATGQGSNQPPNGSNQGSGAPPPQRGRPQRGRGPQSPRTPIDGKLDDLDNFSRRLQKDEARRRATGRATDPQHDW